MTNRPPITCAYLVALSLFLTVSDGVAQQTSTLRGMVVDSSTALSIARAQVTLDDSDLAASTNVAGFFTIGDIPPGTHAIRIEAIGFLPREFQFSIDAQHLTTVDIGVIMLSPAPVYIVGIVGTVTNSSTGEPVAAAQVYVNDSLQTVSEPDGGFGIPRRELLPGIHTLAVRRIGYRERFYQLDIVDGNSDIELDIALDPTAIALRDISVDAPAPNRLARKLQGFYQRREQESGRYMGPDEIDNMSASLPSDIFRRIPGIIVKPTVGGDEVVIARCGAPTYYLDGMYVDLRGGFVNDVVTREALAAIEVYVGAATIPPEFNRVSAQRDLTRRSPCVVLIWTR